MVTNAAAVVQVFYDIQTVQMVQKYSKQESCAIAKMTARCARAI